MAVRLTERDFDLLRFLGAQGVATVEQLTERYFPTRGTCFARLAILKKGGLIESLPLSDLRQVSIASFTQAADLLSIGRQELWKRRVYRLTAKLRKRRSGGEALAEVKMWKHQIQLNGIRALFERLFPGTLILTDPDLRAETRRARSGSDLPIADLAIRGRGMEIAVEVERTLKSETEYFSRFFKYEDSAYTHVIYFCESEQVFNKVADLAKRFGKIGVSRLMTPESVYTKELGFQSLDEFLGEGRLK